MDDKPLKVLEKPVAKGVIIAIGFAALVTATYMFVVNKTDYAVFPIEQVITILVPSALLKYGVLLAIALKAKGRASVIALLIVLPVVVALDIRDTWSPPLNSDTYGLDTLRMVVNAVVMVMSYYIVYAVLKIRK